MAQKKSTGTSKVKKTSKKTAPSKTAKKKAPQSPPASSPVPGRGRAFAVLVIMIMTTVIIVLVNRLSTDLSRFQESSGLVVETGPGATAPGDRRRDVVEESDKKQEQQVPEKPQKAVLRKNVKVYFLKLDRSTEKFYLSPVGRTVSTDSMLKSTLEELVRGPGREEAGKGYITAVPDGLRIRKIQVKNRSAIIDVSDAIEQNAAGDIILHRIDQIVYTATQFDTVDSVTLLINGRRKRSLGSDGLSVSGPLHRRR